MNNQLCRQQFHLQETFATVITSERFMALAEQTIIDTRNLIEAYIARQPHFRTALQPLAAEAGAPQVIRRMADAAARAGVGPMAAVAGAIAQNTVEALIRAGAAYVVMDNGGDIVLFIDRPVNVGVFTGPAKIRDIALHFLPRPHIFSVCTSSGRVGHSLSFGRADAAVVVAADGYLADAMATALGNRIQTGSKNEIEQAVCASLIDGVHGLLVVADERLGLGGELPDIVRSHVDTNIISQG
ncbi:MAG: UPF0280 family protein [Candidatus Aminicenantes bacterium]|nr:UPF0280 family protein [Candidatus Aminicenantes bacterium]